MQEASTQGAAAVEELEQLQAQASPNVTGQLNATHEYYPIMYFVDVGSEHYPSTCTGTPAGKPIVGSEKECAEACNGDVHDCVGFQFFPGSGDHAGSGLCFTMSKMKTVKYWTVCKGEEQPPSTPSASSASSAAVPIQDDSGAQQVSVPPPPPPPPVGLEAP